MSGPVLELHVGSADVTAVLADGVAPATGHRSFPHHVPAPDRLEIAPEELWRAVLDATRDALGQADASSVTRLDVTADPDTVVLWDRDTLGSPRRAIAGADRRTTGVCARLREAGHEARIAELTGRALDPTGAGTRLAWLAEHEPHTWALVEAERYAVGTVESYVVARMTRGLEHVTDPSHAARTLLLDRTSGDWSAELGAIFGVPLDALPELAGPGLVATTDPRTFLDLEVPIAYPIAYPIA